LEHFVLTPPGLGEQASIAGVPTTAGTYKVVVTVAGFQSPQLKQSLIYAIAITPAPSPSPT
jgi:hypothetical protein